MTIRTPSGKRLETKNLPAEYEPAFCLRCGDRIGWADTSITDSPRIACDDCAAIIAEEESVTEIKKIRDWNEESGHRFMGIDPGFDESLKQAFIETGLSEFLH